MGKYQIVCPIQKANPYSWMANTTKEHRVVSNLLQMHLYILIKEVDYTSSRYQKLLKDHGLEQSMSGRGNCWDDAPQESFFG